jgi:hypothetical protein
MSVSPAGLTSTPGPLDKRVTQPTPAAPSVGASSSEVLITERQVLFSTAAARGVRREGTGGRFGAILRRFFRTSLDDSLDDSRPRAHDEPKRYAYLEDALMAREMARL